MDVAAAEIGVEGGLDIAALPDFRKHFLEHGRPLVLLGGTGHVKIVQAVEAGQLFFGQILICGQVQLTAVHFGFHIHGLLLLL